MKKEKLKRFLDQDNVVGYVFASPFILGFLLITVIPMILSLYYSFTDYRLGNPVSWIGLDNYIKMLSDARFLNSIRVTFLYVFASVPVKLIFGLLIAYLLTRNIKGTTFFRSLYYVPSLIGGSISIALVWRELFSKNGLVNIFLERLGAPALSWFSDQKLVMIPLVLMSAWQFGSAMIISLLQVSKRSQARIMKRQRSMERTNGRRFTRSRYLFFRRSFCITWLCRQSRRL